MAGFSLLSGQFRGLQNWAKICVSAVTTGSKLGDLLDRASIAYALAGIADAMTARIMSADVPRSVKEDLLSDPAGVPLILENVAHAQTKLPRNGNGSRPREED